LDPALRSPKERPLFTLGIVFSAIFWPPMVVSVVGFTYALMVLVFAFVAQALMLARICVDGVRRSPRQIPELYARFERAAARVGLGRAPETYVIQADGALNAFATHFLSRDFMLLHADLLERTRARAAAAAALWPDRTTQDSATRGHPDSDRWWPDSRSSPL
jgi:Zn-dependent protease with chaperone function